MTPVPGPVAVVPWPVAASLVAAGGSALLAGHLWSYRGKPGASWFVASLGCQAVWSFAYGVALLTFDATIRWALEILVWVAMTGTCMYFLAFALAYTGRGGVVERFWHLIVGLPAVTAVVSGTNPIHGLSWTGFAIDPTGGMATVTYALLPWSLAGATVGVLLVSVGSLLLFDTVVSYGPLYRGEAVAVGLSTIPPVVALLVWLYGIGPVPELNLATTMFLPHVALDAYAFVGSDMFEFHPATRRAGERAAIDDLGTPVVIVDEQRRVVTLNDAACDRFSVTKSAALTRPLSDLLGGSSVDAVSAESVDADTGDDPVVEDGTVTVQEDGQRTVYSVTTTPLSDDAGTHVGYTVVFQDVTEARRREQRLNVLNRVLRHNLRNDMTVVQGFTEAAADRIDDEETATLLDRAREKAGELHALGEKARDVERVLDRDGQTERVAVASLFETVVDAHADGDADVTVAVDPPDLTIRTDPEVLRVVLDVLLENAFAHGGEGPSVELLARRRDGDAVLSVVDDGPGIPDHELAALDGGVESALEHGSGLGLWLANWGVTSLGGDLSFDVADGAGTAEESETSATGTTATVELPNVAASTSREPGSTRNGR